MQKDEWLLVEGKRLSGAVSVSGSKHSALHILGTILLFNGKRVIKNVPVIDDVINIVKIYQSFGVDIVMHDNQLSVEHYGDKFKYDEGALYLFGRLRSSILILPGLLQFVEDYIIIPNIGGDNIGVRGADDFKDIIELFGYSYNVSGDGVYIKRKKEWCGLDINDAEMDIKGNGNNRSALIILMAIAHKQNIVIKNALPQPEILELCKYIKLVSDKLIYYNYTILGIDIVICCDNISIKDVTSYVVGPDKCEIGFWIAAAAITKGRVEIKVHDYDASIYRVFLDAYKDYFGKMGVNVNVSYDYRVVVADGVNFKPIQQNVVMPYDKELLEGISIDAYVQFLPLLISGEIKSRYLDLRFKEGRVQALIPEYEKYGICCSILEDGTMELYGDIKQPQKIISFTDIRGAASMLLIAFKPGTKSIINKLYHINRGYENMVEKIRSLGGEVDKVDTLIVEINELSVLMDSRIRLIEYVYGEVVRINDTNGRTVLVDLNKIKITDVVIASIIGYGVAIMPQDLKELMQLIERKDFNSLQIEKNDQVLKISIYNLGKCDDIYINFFDGAESYSKEQYVDCSLSNGEYPIGKTMAPLSNKYIYEYVRSIRRIIDYSEYEKIYELPPLMVTIGITDRCNYGCKMCFKIRKNRVYGNFDMTREQIDHFIYDCAEIGVRAIRFCGEGENTLNVHFMHCLLLIKILGMNSMIITNGSTLFRNYKIVARCCDFLRISFNAVGKDSYSIIHSVNPAMYDCVLSGIKKIIEEKDGLVRYPVLSVSSVILKENISDYMNSTPIDLFKSVDIYAFKIDSKWVFEEGDDDVIDEILMKYKTIFDNVIDYTGRKNKKKILAVEKFDDNIGCIVRLARVNIDYNKVYSCVGAYDVYGDISIDGFKEIWKSDNRKKLIKIKNIDGEKCKKCFWSDYHIIFNKINDEL